MTHLDPCKSLEDESTTIPSHLGVGRAMCLLQHVWLFDTDSWTRLPSDESQYVIFPANIKTTTFQSLPYIVFNFKENSAQENKIYYPLREILWREGRIRLDY